MSSDHVAWVRELFDDADYTVAAVRDLLGPVAGAALARDEIVPALRATADGSPLESLIRLFWLQKPVPAGALPHDDLVALGLAERSGDELRALLHVEPTETPYGERSAAPDEAPFLPRTDAGYVVSDLKARPGAGTLAADHVVGQGGASMALGRLVIHRAVDNALDLGTGSGVQAVQLGGRARAITATDVNPRALELARLSFALSDLEVETLEGSLYEPVDGRRFDLIVSNPPFVISPDGRFSYRESGLPGDEVCRRIVQGAAAHLAEDGWCHLLANWLHVDGENWHDRVSGWIDGADDMDGWAVQRDVQDPAEYAELWLRDSCDAGTPEYAARYDAWLDHFEAHKVTGIGFGWITLHNSGSADVRVEDLRQQVDQPVGGYVENLLSGWGRQVTETSLLRTAPGVVQEQVGPPGGDDPERIVLRQTYGLRRAAQVGTVVAALAGACDGDLALGPLLDAIAQLTEAAPEDVRAHAFTVLPELIADGFFEVVDP